MGRIPLKGKRKVWEKRHPGKAHGESENPPERGKASPPLWQKEEARGGRVQEVAQ